MQSTIAIYLGVTVWLNILYLLDIAHTHLFTESNFHCKINIKKAVTCKRNTNYFSYFHYSFILHILIY